MTHLLAALVTPLLGVGLLGAGLVWLAVALVRRVRADGLGRRPGPRSHEPWHAGTWLEDLR